MQFFQAAPGELALRVGVTYASLVSTLALLLVVISTPMWKWNADNPNGLLTHRSILVEGDVDVSGELRMQGLDTVRCEDMEPFGEAMLLGSEQYIEIASMSVDNHLWKSSAKRDTPSKLADGLLSFLSPSCNVLEPDVLHLGQLLVEVSSDGTQYSGQFLEKLNRLQFLSYNTVAKHGLLHFNFSNLLENLPECAKTVPLPRAVHPSPDGVNAVDVEQLIIRLLIAIQELSTEVEALKSP